MKTTTLGLLCHPLTHEPLELESENLLKAVASGDSFPIRDGIPILLLEPDCSGANKKYQKMYDRIAMVYDLGEKLYAWWMRLGRGEMIRQFLKDMVVRLAIKCWKSLSEPGATFGCCPSKPNTMAWTYPGRCCDGASETRRN
jgi:uncharacterized protein YbaR (Trm112 family)